MTTRPARFHLQVRCRTLCLGTALTFAGGGVVHAQATPPSAAPPVAKLSDALTGQAKDDYESGRVLFENGDYAGALVKFQHAFDLSADVRLLWNMGACEKHRKHYTRVMILVERFLRDGGTRISAAQRDEATTVLRTVRPLIGEIEVSVNEAGASVYLDDTLVGATPLGQPILADLGDRQIRVGKPGFKEVSVAAHVTGGAKATVGVTLQPEVHEGHLLVAADAKAAIELDGKVVGAGRWQGAVEPGTHALRITAPDRQPYSSELVVRDGESRSVDVTLQKDASGISPWWWLGGSALVAGLGVGGYFLLRPQTTTADPMQGTITPYTIVVKSQP